MARAGRVYGRATRANERDRPEEAFALVSEALAVLRKPGIDPNDPAAVSTMVGMTAFLDELAQKIGKPEASRDALVEAIETWKVYSASRRTDRPDQLQAHIEHFQRRLAEGS
jgi:hypothetical protein